MNKLRVLIATGIAAAAALYGYGYHTHLQVAAPARVSEPVSAPGSAVVSTPPPAPSVAPAAEPAEKAPPSTATLFARCVQGGFPTSENAQQRNADCSRAIGSRELAPDELALARLIRGSARAALGDKVMASDDYNDALKRYDSLINSRSPDALNLFRRAVAADALGNTEQALDDYNQALRLDPKAALAFLGRGVLLASRKRAYERAIADFDKVLVLEPENVLALIRRGEAFGELGETGRALVDLDRAIALAPNSTLAYFQRGLIHRRRNEMQAALSDYDAAIERGPRNVDALTSRAAIYSLQGKLDLAIRDLDAAIAVDRRNPVAFFNRGYARFAQADYQKAIDDYSAALELDENFGLAYNNRCLTRAIAGRDLLKALADCDVGLRLLPLNLDVRDTRGFIYLKLGDDALALAEYNAALDKDPNRATALFGRGLARIRTGDITGGNADKAAARTLNPEVDTQFAVFGLN